MGSILRLVITTVVICWILAAGTLFLYVRSATWTEDDVRRTGVLLVFRAPDAAQPDQRSARLDAMKVEYAVPVKLMPLAAAREQVGSDLTAGVPRFVKPTPGRTVDLPGLLR